MNKILFVCLLFLSVNAVAQDEKISPLKISGYLETYYLYNFNKPVQNTQPDFFYSFNRANEVNINLAYVKAAYTKDNVRANLALMTGTYANANLASEPGVLKNIFEANAGVKLSSKKNLWIDAGIFSSHIGFESAVGKDNWNLTRSILADNSPYYESGVKLSYTTDDEKWFLSGMVLNGWQRIERDAGNSLPSFGTQVTYKRSAKITLNSSTFIGTNTPDSARLVRYFHNFYGIFQLSDRIGLIAGFDSGIQDKNPHGSGMNSWYSPVVIVRMALTKKLTVAGRGEYYSDKKGVIIYTGTVSGFKTSCFSANIDYAITENALWRVEARSLTSAGAIFTRNEKPVSTSTFLSTSLSINF